jgi:hypothetical protein
MVTNAETLRAQIQQRKSEIDALTELWKGLYTLPEPSYQQWSVWLELYPFTTVVFALRMTSIKAELVGDVIKYASGTMKHHEIDLKEKSDATKPSR